MKKIYLFLCGLICAASAMAVDVATIAQFNALNQGDSAVTTTPLVVLAKGGAYLLATDGTDNVLIYGSGAPACVNGDTILPGMRGIKDVYNNQIEFKFVKNTITIGGHGAEIVPVEIDHAAADNLIVYAKMTGATCSQNGNNLTFKTATGATVAGYNGAKITMPKNQTNSYDWTGFIMLSTNKYQFIPTAWDGEDTPVEVKKVATIAEYNALKEGTEFEFTGEVTVSFVYRIWYTCSTYIQDATGAALIYEKRSSPQVAYMATYEMGDVIPGGWKGMKVSYNSIMEITPEEGFTPAVRHQNPTYVERTFATLGEDQLLNLVLVKNVHLLESTVEGLGAKDMEKHRDAYDASVETFDMYDTFHSNDAATGYVLFPEPVDSEATYDIFGIVDLYYGTYELHPICFDGQLPVDYEETGVEQTEKMDTASKVLRDGVIYIQRDNQLYTITGQLAE